MIHAMPYHAHRVQAAACAEWLFRPAEPGSRRVETAFAPPCDEQRDACADRGHDHVLLRIPFIALCAEPVRPAAGANGLGDHGLEDFKHRARRNDQRPREPARGGAAHARAAQEDLADRKCKQQPECAVDHAVEVIPPEMERAHDPVARGSVRVAVSRSVGVETEEERDERVRGV